MIESFGLINAFTSTFNSVPKGFPVTVNLISLSLLGSVYPIIG